MILEGQLLTPTPDGSSTWVQGRWTTKGGILRALSEDEAGAADLRGWITPGFVDAHCHIGIGPDGAVGAAERAAQMRANLRTGVLAVRDCGVPVDNSELSHASGVPVLIRCGQHVARVKRYIRGLPREVEPAELAAAVSAEAARGDGWVKLVGDWIDRSRGVDADLDPLWPREALVDAVAAAHEAGARVAVHCFSHRVVDDLLEAGVDDIEHGSGMDTDQMAEAASRGTLVTPTLVQVDLFDRFAAAAGTKYPVYAATMRAMFERRRDQQGELFSSGVAILPGTDSGGYQDHGILPDELRAWVALGVDPTRVLDLATWRAREHLHLPPVAEGHRADLQVFSEDPSTRPEVWGTPSAVLVAGALVAGSEAEHR
ncbi:amidohydrolase family protein [Schaalia sp. 19OD2882]|uniref:amidohydrolase family protein n=1 Tax=Schaalia sp. 19OD2882 TaxID=2794089 RepID=UPI001C1EB456|nr:amidohydrolase family protein [Schaalia sp. 19OD2882]QWW18828.1 amidohydrolase family protein [Schaalia sp. 19OD2882]